MAEKVCPVCGKKFHAKPRAKYCSRACCSYSQRRAWDAETLKSYAEARYRVHSETGCWEWTGTINMYGYGYFRIDKQPDGKHKTCMAHKWFYERDKGIVPEGLQLDHLCRNRACVNPAHLEPVTCRENLMRGETYAARQSGQTHCKRGHQFTPENTYLYNNTRVCRICSRLKAAAYRERCKSQSQKGK